jgi:hypothetical protein
VRTLSGSWPGASIDFRPELSEDKVSRREKMTHGRSESPKESPLQGHEPISHSFPSPHFTVQGTGVRSIDTFRLAILPVIPNFPYLEDVRQRRIHSPTERAGTGFSAAGPNLVTRASTSALSNPRRDASVALPNPATSSPHRSFDSKDTGARVNQATSLTFEDELIVPLSEDRE